jgi:hypothetical protein
MRLFELSRRDAASVNSWFATHFNCAQPSLRTLVYFCRCGNLAIYSMPPLVISTPGTWLITSMELCIRVAYKDAW